MMGSNRKETLVHLLNEYCLCHNKEWGCRLPDGSKCPMKRRIGKCHLEHVRDIVRDEINV